MLKIKLSVFLKQTKPKIIVNQHMSTMCMRVKKAKKNTKIKKQLDGNIIKNARNLFQLKNKIKRFRNFSQLEKQDTDKTVTVGDFWNNSYIEH